MSLLFSPFTLRDVTFKNRVWVAAMCQYSSRDGHPTDWHFTHLGARAVGGCALVIAEATAVTPEGRISPDDAGIWNDAQASNYRRTTDFIRAQGAASGIQLAHAGRKGSTYAPWRGQGSVEVAAGGWQTVAPSPIPYADWNTPKELTAGEIAELVHAFADGAGRADDAGFDVVEIHAAHGYLVHQFLSPLTNERVDDYGGDLDGRSRFLIEIVDAVRAVLPAGKPLFVRFSATDWIDGGWSVDETVEVSRKLASHGVDLIDVSSGGLAPEQQIELRPGYQVPFARAVRDGSGLPVAAVGLITESEQAEEILHDGDADAILLARAVLRDPNWPLRAAHELGADIDWPKQYERAVWSNA
jgi:2,4-dienoyl-CoA reductase-like NADH-dependent reductase (Old Yellow Enzyme family)